MLLKEGTVLQDRYVVQSVLNDAGPIDIKYLVRDEQTDTELVIREYFPIAVTDRHADGLSCKARDENTFEYGLAEYRLEGKALARLQHPGVVPCLGQFEENGTIYRVSEHRLGISLRAYLRQKGGKISVEDARLLILQIMDGLEAGHELGLVHGGLSQASVFFDRGKVPVLCNFQAARIFVAQLTGNIKEVRDKGFSPPEIKSKRDNLGPWSDVYAVGCVLYYMITGNILPTVIYPSHVERVKKALDKLNGEAAGLRPFFDNTLVFEIEKRPPTINALRELLIGAMVSEGEPADMVYEIPGGELAEETTQGADAQTTPENTLAVNGSTNGGTDQGSVGSTENGIASVINGIAHQTSPKEEISEATPVSRSRVKLEEKGKDVEEEMLKATNDMENGERLAVTPVPVDRKEDHLPVRRNPREDELRARLAKLENRQKGMNRFFAGAVVLALLVCLAIYINPGLVKPLGLAGGDATTEMQSDAGTETEISGSTLAESPPGAGGDGETEAPGNMALGPEPAAAASVMVDSVALEDEALTPAPVSEMPEDVQVTPGAEPALTPQPVSEASNAALEPESAVVPAVNTQAQQQEAARANAARLAAQMEVERAYQYERGRGDVLFDQAQWQEALDAFEAGLEVRPGDQYLLARIAVARDSLANMTPGDALTLEQEREFQYLLGQGDVLFDDRAWERAITTYKSALALKPENESILLRIASAEDSLAVDIADREERDALEEMIARVTDEEGIFIVPTVPATLLEEAQVRNSVRYPARARRAGVEGRVIVRMIVNEQGKIERPDVVEGIGFGCDEEVLRVLNEAVFQPASFNGKPVKSWYMFSLVFSME